MTKLGTVLFFAPLCSTWDGLNAMFFTARDRNQYKLTVKRVLSIMKVSGPLWVLLKHSSDA